MQRHNQANSADAKSRAADLRHSPAQEDNTMADFVYCGINPPVDAAGTQQLLLDPFNAIWCPPAKLRMQPALGDRIWLVWRSSATRMPVLLGGGRVAITENGRVLWTNATLPGVRPAAMALGYGGPTNMAFLHLTGIVSPQGHPPASIGAISNGLNLASPPQVQVLTKLLPIP